MKNYLIFDSKRYLASSYAGQINGYTPDYIARLCRLGKVHGRLVGRTWYVEEDSLFDFLLKTSQLRQKRSENLSRERKNEYISVLQTGTPARPPSRILNLIEEIGRVELVKKSSALTFAVLLVLGLYSTQAVSRTSVNVYEETFASASAALHITREGITTAGFEASSFFSETLLTFSAATKILSARLEKHVTSVRSVFADATSWVSRLFFHSYTSLFPKLAREQSVSTSEVSSDETSAARTPAFVREGVVVVPLTGADSDSEVKRRIAESFSDEVEIIPDATGSSGIIKPVFKYRQAQNFLYLLVPVRQQKL